jgi:hypothetical protein
MEGMMSQRIRLAAVVVLAVLGAGIWVSAQIFTPPRADQGVTLSGNDLGFRIEERRGDTVVGRLMVRVDGKWVDAEFGGGVRRLH